MKNFRILFTVLFFPIVALSFNCCAGNKEDQTGTQGADTENLNIGWASADITPDKPVIIRGQFYARISDGVQDPITVTALAIESGKGQSRFLNPWVGDLPIQVRFTREHGQLQFHQILLF